MSEELGAPAHAESVRLRAAGIASSLEVLVKVLTHEQTVVPGDFPDVIQRIDRCALEALKCCESNPIRAEYALSQARWGLETACRVAFGSQ